MAKRTEKPQPKPQEQQKRVLPARRTDHPAFPFYDTNYGRRVGPIPTGDVSEDDNPFVENARRIRES